MRNFIAVYVRSTSLRFVAERRLDKRVAHGTIDKFIRGSEPQYETRQLLRKLYTEEYLRDLPTDPDSEVTALFLIHLLNRIPDEHRHAEYERFVRCLRYSHIVSGGDVPPWVERLSGLYEEDGPPPSLPPLPAPPRPPRPPRDPDAPPPEYPRKRGKKKP
ncbi:MAG TPA: hypothetical protein VGV85_00810 [Longimicrobiaceae bacterium]|nr:hypothetical protein [Longimicrobiaceae bacterium]